FKSLLEELDCSTSTNRDNDLSQTRKKSSLMNSEKHRRQALLDSQSEELSSNVRRRSVRRVSSSSTNTSSKTTTKEPLYKRRRINQSDNHTSSQSQRTKRSTGFNLASSDISWDSTDDEINHLLNNSNPCHKSSSVASRT
ncbi:unnamed protein product, partial [Rotaria sp. Silwood1]